MKALALVGLIVVGLGACDSDGGDERVGTEGSSTTIDPTSGPLGVLSTSIEGGEVALTAEPDQLRAGEPVAWRFTVTTTGGAPLELMFSSGQRGDVVLSDGVGEAYRWSAGQVFTQAVEEVTIPPDDREVFELSGTLDVEAGSYTLEATLLSSPGPVVLEAVVEVQEAG